MYVIHQIIVSSASNQRTKFVGFMIYTADVS